MLDLESLRASLYEVCEKKYKVNENRVVLTLVFIGNIFAIFAYLKNGGNMASWLQWLVIALLVYSYFIYIRIRKYQEGRMKSSINEFIVENYIQSGIDDGREEFRSNQLFKFYDYRIQCLDKLRLKKYKCITRGDAFVTSDQSGDYHTLTPENDLVHLLRFIDVYSGIRRDVEWYEEFREWLIELGERSGYTIFSPDGGIYE